MPNNNSVNQFEMTFADLAFGKLQERAPKLMEFMIGFQIIDKDDDGSKAAGCFAFKVGKQMLFAPVFFLNGTLKGYDLLYSKDSDSFFPLQENWVNYLISRKPNSIGKSTEYPEHDLALGFPDFRVYSRSPIRGSFNKMANYSKSRNAEIRGYWTRGTPFDLKPALRMFQIYPYGPSFTKVAERSDLREVLRKMGGSAEASLWNYVKRDLAFGDALFNFYKVEDIFPNRVKVASARRAAVPNAATPAVKVAAAAVEPGKVTFTKRSDDAGTEALSDEQKQDFIIRGYAVEDERKPEEHSVVYSQGAIQSLTNPDSTGVYDVLVRPQTVERMLLVVNPKTIGKGSTSCFTAVRLGTGEYANISRRSIFAVEKPDMKEYAKLVAEADDVDAMVVGSTYIILGPKGVGTLPFTVVSKDNDHYMVNVHGYVDCNCSDSEATYSQGRFTGRNDPAGFIGRNPPTFIHHEYRGVDLAPAEHKVESKGRMRWLKSDARPIAVTDKWHDLKDSGSMLMVPNNFKAYKLEADRSGMDIRFGTLLDAEATIRKQAQLLPVVIRNAGPKFNIKLSDGVTRELSFVDSVELLMTKVGVAHSTARDMLDVVDGREASYFIKQALPVGLGDTSLLPGPRAPSISQIDGLASYDPTVGVPVESPSPIIETANLPMGQPELYNPLTLDPAVMSAAQQASNAGQKEVFDTSVLSALAKTVNSDDSVDEYLSDIVVGLDRIGRLLFMYYWHNDKFRDRYGDDEMKELEDALRNTFKSNGELVLFLKKRTNDPMMSGVGTDADIAAIT
jgi:hypothetical protein